MQAIPNNLIEAGVRPGAGNTPGIEPLRAGGGSFIGQMSQALMEGQTVTETEDEAMAAAKAKAAERAKELRTAAEQLVASTFIMPLFSQLRSEAMTSEMFHGGRGEAIFQQQLDTILSDRISTGAGFDLVDTVAAYFEGQPNGSPGSADAVQAAQAQQTHDTATRGGVDLHG